MRNSVTNRQDGMSIVSLLVGIAVSTLILVILATLVTQNNNQLKNLSERSELRDLRNLILMRVSCDATRKNTVCKPDISLYGHSEKLFIPESGADIGGRKIKGTCASGKITVLYRENGPEPSWKRLFDKSPWGCQIK